MQHVTGGFSSFLILSFRISFWRSLLDGLGMMVGVFFRPWVAVLPLDLDASFLAFADDAVLPLQFSSSLSLPPPMPWVASAVEMRSNPRTAAWRWDLRGGTMGAVGIVAVGVAVAVVDSSSPLAVLLLLVVEPPFAVVF